MYSRPAKSGTDAASASAPTRGGEAHSTPLCLEDYTTTPKDSTIIGKGAALPDPLAEWK